MLDQFLTTGKYKSNVQIFYATGSVNVQGFQKWNKPRGVSMVYMFTIAGGGGGGGTANSANGGGGGGGACSGLVRFICPAIFLPDTLFVQVGDGGQGGIAGNSGGNGTNSYILTSSTAVLPNIVCYSGVNVPGGGIAGVAASAGTGGTVPTIAVTQPINSCGEWFALVGLVGAAGGFNATGTAVTAWAANSLSPGAGGGGATAGVDSDGGAQTATALLDIGNQGYYPTGAGNVAKGGTGTGAGINGSSGISRLTPFFNSGGAGAGSNSAATGGQGGHGGYGCGGGGGGGGTTGGDGGGGGDGLVVIISW